MGAEMDFSEKNIDAVIDSLLMMRLSALIKETELVEKLKSEIDAPIELVSLECEHDELRFIKESRYLLKLAVDVLYGIKTSYNQNNNNCFKIISDLEKNNDKSS
jgi:hypothetical protein